MSIKNWNAGIIRPVPVAPTGPYQDGAAPGVWTLDQVAYWQKQGLWPIAGNTPPDALFFGGSDNISTLNVIQRISIASTGNATDFGDLSAANIYFGSCSSATRGLTGGGGGYGQGGLIYYVTIATAGNAQSFGNLTVSRNSLTAFSNSTRGVFAGGAVEGTNSPSNTLDYVTIASVGNATDFGDLTTSGSANGGVRSTPAACSSTTRGIVAGGDMGVAGATNVIQYVTIASTGNATDFGDLNAITYEFCGFSSATRGCFAGGNAAGARSNTIQYITIASAGNATDFGDLIVTTSELSGTSNSVRGVIGGGAITGNVTNVIQYVTIASTGDAIDFGDLFIKSSGLAACSSTHGGL